MIPINYNLVITILVFSAFFVTLTGAIFLIIKKSWRFRLMRKSYGWAHFVKKEGQNYWEIFKTPFLFGTNRLDYKGVTYAVSFADTEYQGIKSKEELKKTKKNKESDNDSPAYAIFDRKKHPNLYFELGKPSSIQFGESETKFRSSGKILRSVLDTDLVSQIFRSKREKYMFGLVVILTIGLIVSMLMIGYISNQPPIILYGNGTNIFTPPIGPDVT